MSILQQKYNKEVVPELKNKFGYTSVMAVPRIKKVVLNVGFGRKTKEEQERIKKTLGKIAGQLPTDRPARQSLASFKTRQGQVVGAAVTLRKERMYSFLTKLFMVAIPRTRDFRGLDRRAVDESGNLTIGFKEHIMFPEALAEDAKSIFGFEATIVTGAKTREAAIELLTAMGVPFKKQHG